MSIDAVLGKSGSQTACFYALLNWFRSPTGASTMIEDYLLSCILSLYGRVSQRASLSIPHSSRPPIQARLIFRIFRHAFCT